MISIVAVSIVLSQACPPDNFPPTCGGKQSIGGTSVGDPVDFAQGSTTGYITRTDFSLPTPVGRIEFKRTFATRWAPSELPYFPGNYTFYAGVAKPFGGLPSDTGMHWWHSWMGMVQPGTFFGNQPNTSVRTSSGRWISFSGTPSDCGVETYLPLDSGQIKESVRLSCSGSGSKTSYSVVEEDGRQFIFNYKRSWANSGLPTRSFLTEIRRDGRVEVAFDYAPPLDVSGLPLNSCGGASPTLAVPFLRLATIPSAKRRVEFRYVNMGGSCPIKELRLTDEFGANSVVVASYEYATASGGASELRTASTAYGLNPAAGWQWSASHLETYCGYGADFRALSGLWPACNVGQGGEPNNRFIVNANKLVTSATTPTEQFSFGNPNASIISWTRSSGANEALSSSMAVTQTASLQPGGHHNGYVQGNNYNCSNLISCRGTLAAQPLSTCLGCTEYRNENAGATPARYMLGVIDSWTQFTTNSGIQLPTLLQSGGAQPVGDQCSGLLCANLTWSFPGVAPKPTSERRPSVVAANGEASTLNWYHPGGLLAKRVERGWTRTLTGAVVEKAHATFYRLQPICPGAVAYPERITEVEGPCEIDPASTTKATQCSSPVRPITHYTYHQGGGTDVGRIATIRRYPGGCGGATALVTSFVGYLESGYPLYTYDENGQQSIVLRDTESRVVYSFAGGAASYFFYENGKLVRTINPSGQNTISCYRNSTLKPTTPAFLGVRCNGEWTGRLEWVATTDGDAHAASTNFYEAVEFGYGSARTLRTRTYVKRAEGVRRVEVVDVDARGNLTFVGSGSISNPVADVARFDSANLPVARGAAFNKPSTLCGSIEPPDSKCTTLGYDAAGRAISVVIPLAPGVSEVDSIAYDAQGNICDINITGSAQCGSGSGGGQSRLSYEYDDFGNVMRAYLPGTAEGTLPGPKGMHMREYGAGGQLIQSRTPAMAALQETQTYSYDALGRMTATSVVSQSGTQSNYFNYDSALVMPCDGQLQTNTNGRLAREYDPSGVTYYSYDALGRVTNESRFWYNSASRCSVVRYAYRADGQVERVTYPSGLEARYLFDSGTHRVSGVEILQGTPLVGPYTAVWNATWEPFGRLSGYYSQGVWLSYQLGQTQAVWGGTSWQPPANGQGCPTTTGTTVDGTGLPSKLVARNPADGAARLVEEYTWGADQLIKAKRCYNGNNGSAPALETTYQYDQARRLTQASSAAGGGLGPIGTEVWNRSSTPSASFGDERGVATLAYKYSFTKTAGRFGNASPNDVSSIYVSKARARVKNRTFYFDRDGRMLSERDSPYPGPRPMTNCGVNPAPCSNSSPCCETNSCINGFCFNSGEPQFGDARIDTWSKFAPSAYNSMATQVQIFEQGAVRTWQYAFDSQNRRRLKASPSGRRSFFMYSVSKQLLEEAREGATGSTPDTIEEYVYLGGQPVVISRALFNRSTGQRDSNSSNCGEMQHDVGQVSCAWRYPVFDPVVGKATAIFDRSQRIVWTGEYQPMGARNRQEYWGGVYDFNHPQNAAWPGYDGIIPRDQDIAVPTQLRAGLDMKIRVRFALFDMRQGQDSVRIRNSFNQEVWTGSGYEQGAVRTPWLPMTTDVFGVKFVSAAGSPSSHWYAGAHMEGYEWTRFAPGSEAYGTPLGFLGMYYDEETEKYENWNRQYDPFVGNYLSPEPLLQNPNWVASQLEMGRQVPAYAYALNNPIANVDRNGLAPGAGAIPFFTPWSPVAAAATTGWGAAAVSVGATAAGAALVGGVFAAAANDIGTFPDPGAGIPTSSLDGPIPWSGPLPMPMTDAPPNVCEMAKGGKQNIRNHWYYLAQQQPDPCAWLRAQYQAASGAERLEIKKAQKALGCRQSSGGGP